MFTTADTLTQATRDNTEVGTHVLVKVGSGSTLRPAIVERLTFVEMKSPSHRRPAAAIGFSWANGRVTHGRIFATDRATHQTLVNVWLAPEPHSPLFLDFLAAS
jgi:hypothetical protein